MMRAFSIVLVLTSVTALAQQPAERPAADEYTVRVRAGMDQLVAGNTAEALATFQQALAMSATRPEAQYYIAATLRLTNELQGALDAFRQAAALAQAANEPRWQARALHGVASTLERIEGQIEQAREAWMEYTRFADRNTAVSDPAVGRARVQAIDQMNEQERVYAQVRVRIAEREEERRREEREGAQRRRRGR